MLSARGTTFTKQHAIGTIIVVTCLCYVAYRYRENPPPPRSVTDDVIVVVAAPKPKAAPVAPVVPVVEVPPKPVIDCRTEFCAWDRSKRALVVYSPALIPITSDGDTKRHARRAAISTRLRAAGPDSVSRLPPRPTSARAMGPPDTFTARDRRALQITKEHFDAHSVQSMFKRAVASDTDNTLWTISDEVYKNHNEQASPHYEQGGDLPLVWNAYRPLWTCLGLDRVGDVMDGGKWLCDPSGFPPAADSGAAVTEAEREEKECIVYSFGSNLQFDFESAIHRHAPQCEIHIFDPTVSPRDDRPPVPEFVTYHYVGLGSKSNPEGKGFTVAGLGKVESLGDAMIRLGHTHIDLLKGIYLPSLSSVLFCSNFFFLVVVGVS